MLHNTLPRLTVTPSLEHRTPETLPQRMNQVHASSIPSKLCVEESEQELLDLNSFSNSPGPPMARDGAFTKTQEIYLTLDGIDFLKMLSGCLVVIRRHSKRMILDIGDHDPK